MKILFFPGNLCPFHGLTLEERPLGGTETSVIRLAEALHAAGQEVYVATAHPVPPDTLPLYIEPARIQSLEPFDILVVVRGWRNLFIPIKVKHRFFWTGDAWHNRNTFGFGDKRVIDCTDAFLAVSNWHAETMCESSGFPRNKTFVLRNGVKLSLFEGKEERHPKRLIYSSTPFRGLEFLPAIYRDLKQKHPDLELHVYSSENLYRQEYDAANPEPEYESIYRELRSLPDCTLFGSVLQPDLARAFMGASLLAYPNIYEETSCITVMEAQAAGCPAVTTALAALPETVGDAGILIPPPANTAEYRQKFVAACDSLLSNPDAYRELSEKAQKHARACDWSLRANEFLDIAKRVQARPR